MPSHAIVEIEEGSLTAVVGGADGRTARIERTARVPLADTGRDAVAAALRALTANVLQGVAGVHVVLGERRTHHFVLPVPRLGAAEMAAFALREALRVTGLPGADDVLVSLRWLREMPDGRAALGVTALARSAWEPIAAAFAGTGVEVLGLRSTEACLALAATPDLGERTAVLETNAGRARFVLCDGTCPVQVRRFLLGGAGEGSAEAVALQLAMELPRTIDWLEETGFPAPRTLVLGRRVALDGVAAEAIAGQLERVVPAAIALRVADGVEPPSLAATMLLARLAARVPVPSLLDPPGVVVPWRRLHKGLLAAAAAAGIGALASAFGDGAAALRARTGWHAAAADVQRLELDLARANAAAAPPPAPVEDPRLLAALRQRRPASRLLAETSNAAPPGVRVEQLTFASGDRVVVAGEVEGDSRAAALATLAAFGSALRELPYLRADAQEEIGEVSGQRGRFRFRLSLAWRHS